MLSLELLAAFVQPHHPALPPLVSDAAQRLARATAAVRWESRTWTRADRRQAAAPTLVGFAPEVLAVDLEPLTTAVSLCYE